MEQKKLTELLEKYYADKCSEDEKAEVHEWYNRLGQEQKKQMSSSSLDENLTKIKIWGLVKEKVFERERLNTKKFNLANNWKWVAAASIVLFISISFWLNKQNIITSLTENNNAQRISIISQNHNSIQKYNDSHQVSTIKLEDGSIIYLKPGSKLVYPGHFENGLREIILKGEAFFEVAKDARRPFLVYTGKLTTKVLGTGFNIKAYENEKNIEVAVKTGRVSVFCEDKIYNKVMYKNNIVLTPNQKALYNKNDNLLVKSIVENPVLIAKTKTSDFNFENAKIYDVFERMEAIYGIEIVVENPGIYNCSLTAVFDEQTMLTRLEMICKSIGANYHLEDDHIVISGGGCD